MMRRLFFICNALDDATRAARGIVTDSPAASRKIFMLAEAVRQAGVRATVISMGRGKQDGSKQYFAGKVMRVGRVPVIYLPFFKFPILSELLTLFSFIPVLWRFRRNRGKRTALFYNRLVAYLPALIFARTLGFNTVLDLEDGATHLTDRSLSGYKARLLRRTFDALCSGGALLACDALGQMTDLRPVKSCYGISDIVAPRTNWISLPTTFLFGGTIAIDTGAMLLIEAIKKLRQKTPSWAQNMTFEITGKGDCLTLFEALSCREAVPAVIVHGRTSDLEYRQILDRTLVGLALKPNQGNLANTTFPSKVVEFASNDILVLTTDISDVRKILGDGAIYLDVDNVDSLIEKFRWIMENKDDARHMSLRGMKAASAVCSPENVGRMLSDFLFEQTTGKTN
jgi:glycosyltransferase involved in cell wall biosynthesis